MKLSDSLQQLQAKVDQLNEKNPNASVWDLANSLSISEGEAALALPNEYITAIDGVDCQAVLQQLPAWGKVTTIIHSQGSIFEVKAPFPQGKVAYGFYNLMGGNDGQLHGHLNIDLVTDIIFVSKPFKGMESHFIGFYADNGQCVFKVYLGRDKKRQILPGQIEQFTQLSQEFIHGK
ncbi:heme utilization cystosolic carrier protein HutX [Vibrio sp. TH_r3]|uniref:heme utilization cystosolic carrier protein HutX n=1 Tax=Vibrio sp. TH_r3 TaxID=3082084 RepID=UPI002955C7EF|nr:heme utilization cystosolic carrier protein HutX [Vibrio sp. TH_r3]MDV7103966.1 heme utilization cystosolic carrier protein HutX [Vibrio sp. TH_r3]